MRGAASFRATGADSAIVASVPTSMKSSVAGTSSLGAGTLADGVRPAAVVRGTTSATAGIPTAASQHGRISAPTSGARLRSRPQ